MLSILKRAGIVEPKAWCGEAKEMERSFAEAAGQKLEVLIVLGGDGTIQTAAEACAEKESYLYSASRGDDEYASSNVVWKRAVGRGAKENAHCSLSKSAFRRSGREQTVFYRRHCGSACALDTTPRIYAGRKYSGCYQKGERRLSKDV